MFFGQYLLSKGIIDRGALIDAIERQRKANLSLPELAVRRGFLESRQAAAILSQYRTSSSSFEEICLQSEFLNTEQLEELGRIQRSDWLRIGGALVAGSHLTREEVNEHLADYHEQELAAGQRLEADFRTCPEADTVRTCVEIAAFQVGRLADRPVKLRTLSVHDGAMQPGRRRYAQKLVGDRELHIILDLPSGLASTMADQLVGMPLGQDSEAAIDAVCECVNIIGGNACTRLEASGFRLRPEPPFSCGEDELTRPGGSSVRAAVNIGDTEMDVQVFL